MWRQYNCSDAQKKYEYTAIQERVLIQNCPLTCYACGDQTDESCSFPFSYGGKKVSTCVMKDGYRQCLTRSNNWKVKRVKPYLLRHTARHGDHVVPSAPHLCKGTPALQAIKD